MPLGTMAGAWAIEQTKNAALVYGIIGVLVALIPLAFSFTALGHAERYAPSEAKTLPA